MAFYPSTFTQILSLSNSSSKKEKQLALKSIISLCVIWVAAIIIVLVFLTSFDTPSKNRSEINTITQPQFSSLVNNESKPTFNSSDAIVFVKVNKKFVITRFAYHNEPSVAKVSVNSAKVKQKPNRGNVIIHSLKKSNKKPQPDFSIKPI